MAYQPGLTLALVQLTKSRTLKTVAHTCALALEIIGTLLIFLDTVRLDAQLRAAGTFSYTGQAPHSFQHWYYHSAVLGFGFLLAGILAQGWLIWFEHHESRRRANC